MPRFTARSGNDRREPDVIDVRRAGGDDIPAIQMLSRATGQPESDSGVDARYLRFLLGEARVLVAVRAGRVCGWGAARGGPLGDMLTDLFVLPELQGAGIGCELLARLWPAADHGTRLTFSSRHPHALPLYVRAGLLPCWPLLYLTGLPAQLPATAAGVRDVDALEAIGAEQQLAGLDRAAEYRYWSEGLGAQPFVVTARGQLVAAGARLPGRMIHLACAESSTAAVALGAALRAVAGERVTVCLPGPHPAVRAILEAGWRIDDYDLAMTTAGLTLPVSWAYSPALA